MSGRLPFYYGWIILACLCCAGFSRQGPAVATLSVFVEPLTGEFGWSRTALSGAVSLGGVLAALMSPPLGPLVAGLLLAHTSPQFAIAVLAAPVVIAAIIGTLSDSIRNLPSLSASPAEAG